MILSPKKKIEDIMHIVGMHNCTPTETPIATFTSILAIAVKIALSHRPMVASFHLGTT